MTVKHTLVSLDMRVFALCSLMKLHRGQKARTRCEVIYPFRSCQRRRDLWLGADDGTLYYRAGAYLDDHERRRLWLGK